MGQPQPPKAADPKGTTHLAAAKATTAKNASMFLAKRVEHPDVCQKRRWHNIKLHQTMLKDQVPCVTGQKGSQFTKNMRIAHRDLQKDLHPPLTLNPHTAPLNPPKTWGGRDQLRPTRPATL